MKKIWLVLVLWLAGFGCSAESWLAQFWIFKAESAYEQAYALRVKKNSKDERLQYYREACRSFSKAYQHDPTAFTLSRIESAAESCMRVEDSESEEKFRAFGERYAKEHPTETEYGDAFPVLAFE